MAFDDLLKEINAHIATMDKKQPESKSTYNRALPPQASYIPVPEAAPEPSGFISSNLKKGFGNFGQAVGGALEYVGAKDLGQETTDYWKKQAEQYEKERPSMTTKDVTGLGSGAKFVGENVLKMIPIAIPAMAAGAGGGALGAAAGLGRAGIGMLAGAGGFGANLATETGIITADRDRSKPIDRLQIGKASVPAAILETIPEMVGFARTGLGKTGINWLTKKYGPEAAKAAEETAKTQGFWKGAVKVGKDLALTTLAEGATESAQTPLEAWGAGKQVFKTGQSFGDAPLTNIAGALTGGMVGGKNYTPEMQAEMFESGAAGAAGGFGMGAGGHVINKAVNMITDKKTETSLKTDAPTQEVITPATAPAGHKWTAKNVEEQITPELQAQAQALKDEQEAYAVSPEGIQEQEDQAKQTWRDEFFQRTGGEQSKIDKEYKRISSILDVPATREAAIARGEDVDALTKQREWMQTDETIASSSKTIQKELETQQKEEEKRVQEEEKQVNDVIEAQKVQDKYIELQKEEEEATKLAAKEKDVELKQELQDKAFAASRERQYYELQHENELIAAEQAKVASGETLDPFGSLAATIGAPNQLIATSHETIPGRKPREVAAFYKYLREQGLDTKTTTKDSTGNVVTTKYTPFDFNYSADVSGKITAHPKEGIEAAQPIVSPEGKALTEALADAKELSKGTPHDIAAMKKYKQKYSKLNLAQKKAIREELALEKGEKEKVIVTPPPVEESVEPASILKASTGELFAKVPEQDQRTSKEGFSVDDATKLIKHLLGPKAKVQFINDTTINLIKPDGTIVEVEAAFLSGILTFAKGSGTLYENIRHEAIHAARQMGIFTDGEWRVLELKANKWIKEFGIKERYPGLTHEQHLNEAIARAFEARPDESSVFKRLGDFFEKVVNFVRGLGYVSSKGILDSFESGILAKRASGIAQSMYEVLAKLDPNKPMTPEVGEKLAKELLTAFGKNTTDEAGVDLIHSLREAVMDLRGLPEMVLFQDAILAAQEHNNPHLAFNKDEAFFNKKSTLSFSTLHALPKDKRAAALVADVIGSLEKSRIGHYFKKNVVMIDGTTKRPTTKAEAHTLGLKKANLYDDVDLAQASISKKEIYNRVIYNFTKWNIVNIALTRGEYINEDNTGFYTILTNEHRDVSTDYDWNLDSALFSFLHTGLTNPDAVPELFLPYDKDERMSEKGYKANLLEALRNGYKARMGLDINHSGVFGNSYHDLAYNSNLVKDVLGLAKEGNQDTFIRASDYTEAKDRNVIAMGILNYLAKIKAITIYDYAGQVSKKASSVDFNEAKSNYNKEKNLITQVLSNNQNPEEVNTDGAGIYEDVSLGDTYFAINPNFISEYVALGNLKPDSKVTIERLVNGKLVRRKTKVDSAFSSIMTPEERVRVFSIVQNKGGMSSKFASLLQVAYDNVLSQPDYKGIKDTDPLDQAQMRKMHTSTETKTIREAFGHAGEEEYVVGLSTERNINGYPMPIPYSLALHMTAGDAYKRYKNKQSAGHTKEFDTDAKKRILANDSKALLYRAIGAAILHQNTFGIPIQGTYKDKHGDYQPIGLGNLLTESLDFFNNNGVIVEKVRRLDVFTSKVSPELKTKFDVLAPSVAFNLKRALAIIDKFGFPSLGEEATSKIALLEKSATAKTDKSNTFTSVSELMDAMLEETTDEDVTPDLDNADAVIQNTELEEGVTPEEDVEKTEDEVADSYLGSIEESEQALEASLSAGYIGADLTRLVSRKSKKGQLDAALNSLLTTLTKRNEAAGQVLTSKALKVALETPAFIEGISKFKTVEEIKEYRLRELKKLADKSYKELIDAVKKLQSGTVRGGARETLISRISTLAELLSVEYESKDARVERDVKISLSEVFEDFSSWEPTQQDAMIEQVMPMLTAMIYENSAILRDATAPADERLEIQVNHTTTTSATGTKIHYLNVSVASPVSTLTAEQYKEAKGKEVARFGYTQGTFDESKYDAQGNLKPEQSKDISKNIPGDDLFNLLGKSKAIIAALAENRVQAKLLAKEELKKIQADENVDKRTRDLFIRELEHVINSGTISNSTKFQTTDQKQAGMQEPLAYKPRKQTEVGEAAYDEDAVSTPVIEGEIPPNTIYKSKSGIGFVVRVLPNTTNLSKKHFVVFEVLDAKGKRVKTELMGRTSFEKKYTLSKKQEADLAKIKQFGFDTITNTAINNVRTDMGLKYRPLVDSILNAFAKGVGDRLSIDALAKQFFDETLLRSQKDFREVVKDIIFSMNLRGLVESAGKDTFVAKQVLINFYKDNTLGAKTQAKIDLGERAIAAMSQYNNQHTIIEKLKQVMRNVPEFWLIRLAKSILIPPWNKAKSHPIWKKVMGTAASKSEKRQAWFGMFVNDKPIDTVIGELRTIKEQDPIQFTALDKLITQGDKLKKEFKNFQEAQAISPTLTAASFKSYQNLREMINKVLPKKMEYAGAHIYTEWLTQRFDPADDHLFANAFIKMIAEKGHTSFDKDQVNGITDSLLKLIEDKEVREKTRSEMRNAVKGYIAWLEEKRAFTAATPGWMPRIRYVKDWVGSVKNANGDLTHFNYFNSKEEAQAFVDQYKTDKAVASVEKTDADTRRLFTSLDKIRGLESVSAVDNFLSHGMSENIGGTPNFGVGILDSEGAGGVHQQKRVKGLVEGYETGDFLTNYLNSFARMANAFGQLQYGLAQREHLMKARELSKTDPAVKENLAYFTRHLQLDLAPAENLEGASKNIRNMTVFTFLGFRMLPALINMTQPFVVGVPMLARRLSEASGDSYSVSLGKALSLTRVGLRDAYKDLHANVLSKEDSVTGKVIAKLLGASLDEAGVERHTIGLSSVEEAALKEFYKYNVATQSIAHASSIINDYKEEAIIAKENEGALFFNRVVNNSMTFMRLTEQLNRTASFLASYRAQPTEMEERQKIRNAAEFVNNSQFMNTAFNMPIGIKELGPTGRAIMTLGMYPIHLLNGMFEEVKAGPNGIKTVMLIIGMTMMIGGGAALPFKDFWDFAYSKITKRNLNLDTRSFIKNLTDSDTIANVAMRGLPTLLGVDIANNVAMPTPFIGGVLADKSVIESGAGAAGGLLKRFWGPITELDAAKIIQAALPEAIASPIRTHKAYTEGYKTAGGAPQMFQGKPLTADMGDFLKSIVGLKSARMGEIQEKRQIIRTLEKQYKGLAAEAITQARETGDMSRVQKLNQLILKNNLSSLIKPVKVSKPKKETSGKISFESSI